MDILKDLFYTKDHEWARIEGNSAYVGITEYAAHSLGDITFVELPKPGEALKQESYCATVESVKAASEVYAPFSGKVISVNSQLSSNPELVNQSPYDKGYFFLMELSDPAEKARLMDAESYRKYTEGLSK
ncbi:MAG: glycine cleavage system protein GcvH [Candidatus Omnitrophica bacterium]|jgi:glycine cleavage system H protein|nr:glycine cleavage system protein GcvH [Candidatus Omnitrophota bacterium]MDD3274712.1 glycine cleavage system protein GcvH [Candidatus Omnitrophota bacterium]MDD5077780.1 glycine cleavage system protein GcvH [Candidatus Omnitrophota bacterium]MDD5725675.1 glycine cleavage system protein GcvH [Candidatus Omnitrophota bacterium]